MVRQAIYDAYKEEAYTRASVSIPRFSKISSGRSLPGFAGRTSWNTTNARGIAVPRVISIYPQEEVGEEALEDALQEELDSDDV